MFKFLKKLQWQLALSYAVVTVATVVVLVIFFAGMSLIFNNSATNALFNSYYWSKTGFQDNVPLLVNDVDGLQKWLEKIHQDGFNKSDLPSADYESEIRHANTLVRLNSPIYILDANLNVLAAVPQLPEIYRNQPFQAAQMMGSGMSEEILTAARKGDKNYRAQSQRQDDGSYIVAFPLRKTDDDPVSAIAVYRMKPLVSRLPSDFSRYTEFFTFITIMMILIALPVGALFGTLVSRNLRERLRTLSRATQAWSKGNFQTRPSDSRGDEIGELTRDLNSMAGQLQTLLQSRDELSRVEERNRLARELHDTIKQQTYASRMQLSAAVNLIDTEPEQAKSHVEAALQLNRESQQELKLIIEQLRPAKLQEKGLPAAMTEYLDQWHQTQAIEVEKRINPLLNIPLKIEVELYRIMQECLANIVRHAKATKVVVSLNEENGLINMSLQDNGIGFEPGNVPQSSSGLAGMQERLKGIGGELIIDSIPGTGTRIITVIPQPK